MEESIRPYFVLDELSGAALMAPVLFYGQGEDRISALTRRVGNGRLYWQFHPTGPQAEFSDRLVRLLVQAVYWCAEQA